MRKSFCACALILCCYYSVHAAPGDTTWVEGTNARLSWYGNYDSTIVFPHGKTFRSIYMIFTLGKYICPGYNPANPGSGTGQTGWCGDWDYTVQNYVVTPGGQSYELGRMITPYANALTPRMPWTATQNYVYDVTDYAPLLHDTATVRTLYSGYSGGFTGRVRFAFIEGTPDRDVTGIHRLWNGSFGYGGTPDINSHFVPVVDSAPEYTQAATLKFIVTGHGSDANGCCEFMSHNYQVVYNGNTIANKTIWRDDCGANELYPQSGTWLFQRANWCPGALVHENFHPLPGVVAGTKFRLGLKFDPYVGGGSYTTEAILFFYGGMKKTLDASLDQIISPNIDDKHYRENPICGSPVVHVKNRGSATINNITFRYGMKGGNMVTYTWSGTLSTFAESDITLPELRDLTTIAGDTLVHTFLAKIVAVNGSTDADSTNNAATSSFLSAPVWPNVFRVMLYTNNENISSDPAVSENSWAIYDKNNDVVMSRTNLALSHLYTDTVRLTTGYYKLVIYDSSCDGLNWWLFSQMGVTPGYFNVKQLKTNNYINMKGYNYSGTYNNDFGCGFSQYFYTVDSVESITSVSSSEGSIEVYPNPAQEIVHVDIAGISKVQGKIIITDALGRVVLQNDCRNVRNEVNTHSLLNGLYNILFVDEATGNKLTARLLIAK